MSVCQFCWLLLEFPYFYRISIFLLWKLFRWMCEKLSILDTQCWKNIIKMRRPNRCLYANFVDCYYNFCIFTDFLVFFDENNFDECVKNYGFPTLNVEKNIIKMRRPNRCLCANFVDWYYNFRFFFFYRFSFFLRWKCEKI